MKIVMGIIILIMASTSLFAEDCGDVNSDGKLNLLDVSYTINHLYRGGPEPICWARPVLTAVEVSEITSTTAKCGGTITSDGGATVTARGVCWSTNVTPTIADSKTTNGAGGGSFTSSITGLTANTFYYVRAYATNSASTGYGMTMAFTTSPIPPELTTADVSEITQTTAQCGGSIISEGGAAVTVRGVCWSTNPTPTIANNKTTDGSGAGSFTSSIVGLTGNTPYYVRAYATNSAGTGYGNILEFITSAILPVLTTTAISEMTETTAQCGGTITSDGGAMVTARGVCWSTNATPTIADYFTSDGAGTGSFTSSITGLTAGTYYYVRAYATNSVGTAYGNTRLFAAGSLGTVMDIDGNEYLTVTIGTQVWMAENLKTTHYNNGDAIPNVTDGSSWESLATGAYCEYNNNVNNVGTYGRLYNWYAASDSRNIAPAGWHVPTDAEWKQLEMYLGLSQAEADATGFRGTDEGGKLKESGTIHWSSPNNGATNESGFTGLPAGYRYDGGSFDNMTINGHFWTSNESSSEGAWDRALNYSYSSVYRNAYTKRFGFSVRCVKDN
jgi:uncharacterized protein (TIGR02145 family)